MKKILCAAIMAFVFLQSAIVFAKDILPVPYSWGNIPIGGSGFVTGIVIHPTEPNLIYTRTDVGGAYRWNEDNQSWVQICDAFGFANKNFYGIDGLALDPANPDIVYMAAGKFTWDTPSDVLKSTDRGQSWQRTNLNKTFDSNGLYRGYGECIGVDPNNSSIIYCGTALDGLYKSTDAATTWSKIPAITTLTDKTNELRVVAFDKNTAVGGVTQTIYAAVTNKGIYRTQNGGTSWSLISGSPNTVRRIDIGASGAVYVASTVGLYKFYNETWTEISPSDQIGKNHAGITVDPNNENIMMCVGYSSNTMRLPIYYSNDDGKTWVNKWSAAKYTSILPWQTLSGDFSSNTSDIKLDPYHSGRVWFVDWFGVYKTENILSTPQQAWTNCVKGIEEVVPADAISQPSGKYHVMSAIADVDGFALEDITQFPTRMINKNRAYPYMMSSTAIDFCEQDPNIVVRVGVDPYRMGRLEISTDNAETWTVIKSIPYYYDKNGNKRADATIPFGRVAVSSQKNPQTGKPTIVIIPAYAPNTSYFLPPGTSTTPLVSFDLGVTWQYVVGLPSNLNIVWSYQDTMRPIASDRVNGSKFYIFTQSTIYISEDWGLTWRKTSNLPSTGTEVFNKIITAPYLENEVWINTGNGLYCSSDGGLTMTKVTTINSCVSFGFGKNAPGKTNPTLFLYGTVENKEGIYLSIDMGITWVQINDEYSKIGNSPNFIVGDRQQFGVVYIGTNGSGIFSGMFLNNRSDYSQFEQSFANTLQDGWELNNMSVNNGTLVISNGANYGMAMYKSEQFSGNYKLSANIQFYPFSSTEVTQIIFNYSNKLNYYYVEISNNKVSLKRKVDGISTSISEANYNINGKLVNFDIFYEVGGFISVQGTINGSATMLISKVKDTYFTKGYIGLNTTDLIGLFSMKVDDGIISNFDVQLKNGSNIVTALADVSAKMINVDLTLRSNSLNDVNCKIIACIKDGNGVLKSIASEPAVLNGGVQVISIPIYVPNDATNNFKVICYYWDSINNLMPIVKSIVN